MTVEKYDSGKTRELADVYGVGNCLRKYRDVATANSGKCPLTIEADVIDSDSAKIVQKMQGKSVDAVFVTEMGRIVFAEMKMGVKSKEQCEPLSEEIRKKINTSVNFFSGKGTFTKFEYSYVLLSNDGNKFNQLVSRLRKFFSVGRDSRKIEIVKDAEFEKIFFD